MTTAVADPAYRIRSAHYTVPSHTTPGKTYRVDVDPSDGLPVACQCPGYRRYGRCRHLAEASRDGYKLNLKLGLAPEPAQERAQRLQAEARAATAA